MNKKVLLINGPNLNLLGQRQTSIYGEQTLQDIVGNLKEKFAQQSVEMLDFQSNHEGEIIEFIHREKNADYVLINPAAFSHTSVALYDAFLAVQLPFVEVHISNISARENFRHFSYLSSIAKGVLFGFGIKGYDLAADFILSEL